MPSEIPDHLLPHDLDAADTLYVTDRDLNVIYTNQEWVSFADENRGRVLLDAEWNPNLLDSLSGSQRERWQRIYEMLAQGRLPHHQEQMNCSSPSERRIYQLRVTPRRDERGEVEWFVHHNVRIDQSPESVQHVAHQLDQLKHQASLEEEFHRRIADRAITIPNFEVARHFEPLEKIGGDLVWHREYPDGVSDLIHADVMGHGAEAGLVAARIAIVLDEIASIELTPRETVATLNDALLRIGQGEGVMFTTGLCFRFEKKQGRVTCSNFGHEGPIFSQSGPITMSGGFLVGLMERSEPWPEATFDLSEHGRRFLVFSDGITEQFNDDGAMFGVEGLFASFQRTLDLAPDEMVHSIVEELRSFRGTALVKDDQTLLALDFTGGEN